MAETIIVTSRNISLSLHVYVTKVQSIHLYKAQLIPIPKHILHLEKKWLHSMAKLPWNALGTHGLYALEDVHSYKIQSLEVAGKAAMCRAAINSTLIFIVPIFVLGLSWSRFMSTSPFFIRSMVSSPLPGGTPLLWPPISMTSNLVSLPSLVVF